VEVVASGVGDAPVHLHRTLADRSRCRGP
jgi:hypothetical protein